VNSGIKTTGSIEMPFGVVGEYPLETIPMGRGIFLRGQISGLINVTGKM